MSLCGSLICLEVEETKIYPQKRGKTSSYSFRSFHVSFNDLVS